MNKIKEYIIHALGGITIEEHHKLYRDKVQEIRKIDSIFYMNMAKAMYGLDAKQWCEDMYQIIETNYKLYNNE